MQQTVTVRLSMRNLLGILLLVGVVTAALRVPTLLVEVFLALVLASAMLPGVRFLEARARWPRLYSTLVMFVGVLAAVGLLGVLVVPRFIDQAGDIAAEMPAIAAKWTGWYQWLRTQPGPWHYLPAATTLPGQISAQASQLLGQGLGWVRQTLEAVVAFAIVFVLAFFVLLDGRQLREGAVALVPPRYRKLFAAQIEPISYKLGAYVQGTLVSMAFFIAFQATVLSVVGLPLALGVSVLAGVLEVIPILGTVTGIVLSVSIAATVSVHMIIAVLVVFAVGRLLQDNLVNPYVFSHSLEMPPTLVIVSLLLGTELMGIAGALIAVPLLAAVQVLVQNLYVARMPADELPVDDDGPVRLRVSFLREEGVPGDVVTYARDRR